MNNYFKHFVIVFSLFFINVLFAHNPLQSSMRLTLYQNNGLLSISLPEYGIEQAIMKKYPNLDLHSTDPKIFKEILINYIKENVILSINGQQLKISSGVIKLGSHQTDLKFKIDNLPENPKYVDVDAHCFQENEKQQNFFRIAYKDLNARKKLNKKNDFKTEFIIFEDKITVNENAYSFQSNKSTLFIWGIVLFSIMGGLTVLIIKLRKKKQSV